jgi:tRNA pseudouridine38-40 synthase
MRSYRLILAYDGSDFHGWQRQPGLRTVQGELERVLAVLAGEGVAAQGAGRTDAGVHALGQCASFTLSWQRPTEALLGALRGLLPADISALALDEVGSDFNARFSATARGYLYRLATQPCAPLRRLRWDLPYRIDPAPMAAAMEILARGEDFAGFTTAVGAAKGTRCQLRLLALEPDRDELRLRISADRFLHKMVRIITGTLVEIGRGRWGPERVERILSEGDRRLAGPAAPPRGLFLEWVEYAGGEAFGDSAPGPGGSLDG